ncbi:site-specific integrase [Massilia putida]|uniref:site-specific integrase n=1 Tax=Massilia putida TaxID=1141883 RepID=UPI0014745DEC|nr:site-specific integrase [Massilia putida]
MSEEARTHLFHLWENPLDKLYRPADTGPRIRNVVMLRVLYETGMRRGELLSLKLGQFAHATGGETAQLVIERNHHDEYDTRVHQPVAKTRGRIVPITDELEEQLLEYIVSHRAEVPGVGFSDDDFIFVTHRAGREQGAPIQIATFDQALQSLKKAFPAIRHVHPHLLRHDWNYRFSSEADKKGLDPHKERELRSILMGWTENSEMALLYNMRHTQEESLELGLIVASDTKRDLPPQVETS